jgi:hypothetical protein
MRARPLEIGGHYPPVTLTRRDGAGETPVDAKRATLA